MTLSRLFDRLAQYHQQEREEDEEEEGVVGDCNNHFYSTVIFDIYLYIELRQRGLAVIEESRSRSCCR